MIFLPRVRAVMLLGHHWQVNFVVPGTNGDTRNGDVTP